MFYYAVGFAVWLHVFFWGAALAVLAMPAPWRRFWPVLAWPAGLTLQSVVVWLGAYAGAVGTDSYAWWSEALPLALTVAVWRWRGGSRLRQDLGRFWGLGLLMAVNLAVLLAPLARVKRALTTISLGSQDAPDYAAGARVLKEFAHGDRGGFLGLTEVVRVMSVDNFYDFWLRLNHFTPSALIAFNGTIVDCLPHELTGVMTVVLLVVSLPVVFWCARAVLGYGAGVSLWVAAVYGFGPVTWYAVYHEAMGQLLAAPAIALLTWAGIALWRGRISVRRAAAFGGVLAIGYALVLGGYNFILLVCLCPALAYAGGSALERRDGARLGKWLLAMLAPLVLCGLIFWERVAGLAERFQLFQAFDFGWRVPLLTLEGWLGLVADHHLHPLPDLARAGLMIVFVVALIAAVVEAVARGRRAPFVAGCLAVPALIGYGFLQWRGLWAGTNASYDAYKILAVFYPGLLPAIVFWAAWGWRPEAGRLRRGLVLAGMTGVLAGNLWVAWLFAARLETPPLGVSRELVQLRRLEQDPQVKSVNVLITDGWSRLWANAQLLRLPQYFETHTYEGRLNTPLRGEWDLVGGVLDLTLPAGGSRRLGPHYSLLDTRSPSFFRARFGRGWYEMEQPFRLPEPWRWARRDAEVELSNPQPHALVVDVRLKVRSLTPRDLQLWLNGRLWATVPVGTAPQVIKLPQLVLPPGESKLAFRAGSELALIEGDPRDLEFACYLIGFDARAEPETMKR